MPETLTLTTPETKPTNPTYMIQGINETWLPVGQETIEILLVGANGEQKRVVYSPLGLIGPTGLVVGGTPSCDDSVACTDDRCDATAGRLSSAQYSKTFLPARAGMLLRPLRMKLIVPKQFRHAFFGVVF